MPNKKDDVTKPNEIPKKIDSNEKQETSNQKIGWVQILLLLGKPIWDAKRKKWRILNGYQSVLGNQNNQMFFEVTFTDSPYWENFIEKELYIDIPKEQEDKSNADNGSNKKANELKQKMKNKQYIQVRKDASDSYGYIEAIDTLVRKVKMYQR